MHTLLSLIRSRAGMLLGIGGLAMLQAACAHPVVVEPAVVVQARVGGPVHGSVYAGPVYAPPPVVVAPPAWWFAPPPVVVSPRHWGPPGHRRHHGWHGHGREQGWGRHGG